MWYLQNKKPVGEFASIAGNKATLNITVMLTFVIALLPVANGLLFRTYFFPRNPPVLDFLADFEFLYVMAEICVIFWAREQGMSFRNEFRKLKKSTKLCLIFFLVIFPISSVLYAPNYYYSSIRATYWVFHISFAFAVSYLISSVNQDILDRIVKVIVGGFFVFCVLVAAHFVGAPVSLFAPTDELSWSAIVPGNLSIRHFGMISGFVLALWLGAQLSRKQTPTLSTFIVTSLLFATMLWSGTRSALLGVSLAIPLVIILSKKRPSLQSAGMVLGAIIAGAAISMIWVPPHDAYGMFNAERMAVTNGVDVTSGRLELWKFGFGMFAQSPLLGWGEGSYYHLLQLANKGFHLQPHNFIIQFLVSWGVIATGIALFMMARALIRLHKDLRRSPLLIAPLAMLDSILVMAMLDSALFTLRTILPAIFIWIIAEKIYQANTVDMAVTEENRSKAPLLAI